MAARGRRPARRSNSQTANRRSCVGSRRIASSSSSLHSANAPPVSVSRLRSSPRIALISAARERAADAHRFAGRLHLRARARIGERELVERPARDLHDAVVERRFVGGFRDAGDGVGDLVERLAERDARRDLRNRIAGRFRCQRRAARDARVDLDDCVFAALGMQRELNVAAALDVERADDVDAGACAASGTRGRRASAMARRRSNRRCARRPDRCSPCCRR